MRRNKRSNDVQRKYIWIVSLSDSLFLGGSVKLVIGEVGDRDAGGGRYRLKWKEN